MITYSFPIVNVQNYQKIIALIESNYNAMMHSINPLPSTLININGYVGLSTSPNGLMLYVNFFETISEYSLKNSTGNIIYQSKPMVGIPQQSDIRAIIERLL